MKTLLGLALVCMSVSVSASAGEIQCASVSPRHHLTMRLPDSTNIVEVVNENIPLHYTLSPESARRNRLQLPVELTSVHGDMILRMFQAGQVVHGTLKLRVLDERIPMVCRYQQDTILF